MDAELATGAVLEGLEVEPVLDPVELGEEDVPVEPGVAADAEDAAEAEDETEEADEADTDDAEDDMEEASVASDEAS